MDEGNVDSFFDWVSSSGVKILLVLAAALLIRRFSMVFVTRAVRRTIRADRFATKKEEEQREKTLVAIVNTVLHALLYAVAVLIVLSELGIDIGPLIAGAGIAGLAIGFGAQSLVKDFVSGIFILMENQYRVGDIVELGGVSGKVESITMRETVLRDLDGNVHHVPNGNIDVATNKSMEFSKINLNIGVSYEADLEKVETIVNQVGQDLAKDEAWREKIEQPPKFLRVNEFGDSAVEVKITGKTVPGKQWAVMGELRKRLKIAFDKNHIEIPYPQRVIHQTKK